MEKVHLLVQWLHITGSPGTTFSSANIGPLLSFKLTDLAIFEIVTVCAVAWLA